MSETPAHLSEATLHDCIVVGGGPAGLVAGLYLKRFHRDVVIVDAGDSRAAYIPQTHNFPGFPPGISGRDLLALMRRQYAQVRGAVIEDTVTGAGRDGDAFKVTLRASGARAAPMLLLCSGVKDVEPGVPGIARVREAGLLRLCPICDGYEYTGRPVVVFGNSKHGVDEAVYLRSFTAEITFVHLGGPLPEELRQECAAAQIRVLDGQPLVCSVTASGRVALTMNDGATHVFDAVYGALGVTPRFDYARPLGAALDDCGNFVVDAHCRTSVPGLYAAGDIVSGLNQIVVSVGQAAVAATAVHNLLPTRWAARHHPPGVG